MNPARSTGPALFVGSPAIGQLWLFWVAPIIGAAIAGLAYHYLMEGPATEAEEEAEQVPVSLDLRQREVAGADGKEHTTVV